MPTIGDMSGELLTHELGTSDTSELFTSARRTQAVIEGEREFANVTECLIRESTVTTSNGVAEYDLLSTVVIPGGDFIRMAGRGPEYRLVSSNSTAVGSTRYVAGDEFPRSDIERLNRRDPGWRNSTGSQIPTDWYLKRESGKLLFGMYPPPTVTSSESGALRIPYVAYPATSTESTHVPFTYAGETRTDLAPYHRAIVHWAAHKLEKLRRDIEASEVQLQKFTGYVQEYLEEYRPKGGQRVTLSRNYLTEAHCGATAARRGEFYGD